MGAGGQMSGTLAGKKPEPDNLRRAPCEKPPFTLGDIKRAIPSRCFQRSLLRSSSYLVYDLTIVVILYYAATNYIKLLPSPLSYLVWPLYWACQGCMQMGLWVIAHECGHQAFSNHHRLNDLIGLVLHSALLVPYFAWKHTHHLHHSNTASVDRDENFVPKFKSGARWFASFDNPPGRVFILFLQLTIGWPSYLFLNVTGRRYHRVACHFDPYSPLFTARERLGIFVSDAGILATSYFLYRLGQELGFAWVFRVYGIPLLIVNAFLVLITYLHHTHSSLPHYDSSEWEWLRGALSTVDRDYGVLNHVFHNISTTHVLHHLLPTVPHYHAVEATEAIKPVLGEYYRFDGTPIVKALYREIKECVYIESDEAKKGVFWYKNKLA